MKNNFDSFRCAPFGEREALNCCAKCGGSKVSSFVFDVCICEEQKEQKMSDKCPNCGIEGDEVRFCPDGDFLVKQTNSSGLAWHEIGGRDCRDREWRILRCESKHLKEVCGRLTEDNKHFRKRDKRQRRTIGKLKEVDKKAQLKIRRQAKHITGQDASIVKLKQMLEYAKTVNIGLMKDVLKQGQKASVLKAENDKFKQTISLDELIANMLYDLGIE